MILFFEKRMRFESYNHLLDGDEKTLFEKEDKVIMKFFCIDKNVKIPKTLEKKTLEWLTKPIKALKEQGFRQGMMDDILDEMRKVEIDGEFEKLAECFKIENKENYWEETCKGILNKVRENKDSAFLNKFDKLHI